ncbi:hypothetical protein SpAn4DRAFT_5117 [Sporomusa ovata]|uniref:Uncharacterized protein n=1 Tax=Sporomusa ovata TaxID=2378 RepID=A0A0U1L1A1_9FIRM|nr:hypothetical protein SpAn4DRAFT_5117 [Sporomusa ovata]
METTLAAPDQSHTAASGGGPAVLIGLQPGPGQSRERYGSKRQRDHIK